MKEKSYGRTKDMQECNMFVNVPANNDDSKDDCIHTHKRKQTDRQTNTETVRT
jgi:hypothetical protein